MKIAVLMSTLSFDSQKQFIRGVIDTVKLRGDQCFVFCSYGGINGLERYNEGESNIMTLPDFEEFDGIIYVKNTVYSEKLAKKIEHSIKKSGVPCVMVNSYEEGYVCIGIDNKMGMGKIVEHMIFEHNCKKFFYVSGPRGNSDAELRRTGFIDTVNKYNIDFKDEYIYYGDYRPESGRKAVRHFLDKMKVLPDVFVCANDSMAIGVSFELAERGIKVPEQVKITGVDFTNASKVNSPQITTLARPQYELGQKACEILWDYDSYDKSSMIELNTRIINTESCGCPACNPIDDREIRRMLIKGRYEWGDVSGTEKSLSCELAALDSIAGLRESILRFIRHLEPDIFCLLRCDDDYDSLMTEDYTGLRKRYSQQLYNKDYTDMIIPEIVYMYGKLIKSPVEAFPRKKLLPDIIKSDKPGRIFFFVPLHYMEKAIGYCVFGDSIHPIENSLLFTWINAIATSFETIYKQTAMKQLIVTLDKMWIYDTLTGLYNRAGFLKLADPIIAEGKLKGQELSILFFDVDGLKTVNDMYGHEEGDIYLKGVAKVITDNKPGTELIMRYGGDEFVMLIQGQDEQYVKEYIRKVKKAFVDWSIENNKPYEMSSSIGYHRMNINNTEELSQAIECADIEMYKEKKLKKAQNKK